MAGSFEFEAELRPGSGKSDARRARRAGKVPIIIYGGHQEPLKLNLYHHKVMKALENEAFYAHVLSFNYDGKVEKGIVKAIQRHPSRPIIMHMDFQRVSDHEKIKVHVPIHFLNQETSVGVKKGGVINHNLVEVEVTCLPQHLPEFLEVDLSKVDIGDSVHISDIKLPNGVDIHALHQGHEHDLPVATILASRVADVAE